MKRWKAWVGIGVSVAAIAWAMRGVEWSLVGPALADADWRLLALVFLLAPIVNVWVRAVRWRISLWPVRRLPLSACFSATAIGLFVNNVLPARIGEFVRAYALARKERVPTGTALGGLFIERMFDGFALVGILWGVTRVVALPSWAETTANVAFWIFVGFLAFQILLVVRPRAVIGAAQWIRRRLFGGRFEAGLEGALATFVDGFRLLRRPGLLAVSAALAVVQWTLVAGLFWLGMAAFGFGARAGAVPVRRPRRDRPGRWRARRHQAARGDPGHRRDPRARGEGGRVDRRDPALDQAERAHPVVHLGEPRA